MVPLLKHGERLNESLGRMEDRMKRMNPNDFRYKMMKSRFEMLKASFMSFRVVFENKIRLQNINKFYNKLLENFIRQYE